MNQRTILIAVLLAAAVGSTWLLNRLSEEQAASPAKLYHDPDYYMEDFTTLTMRKDGTPRSRLHAAYMAHYPDDDTTELLQPEMEMFRTDKEPLHISAEKGWVTSDNEALLLRGGVRLWEDDKLGQRVLQVDTTEVRVLINDQYAETDQFTTIRSKRNTVTGTGLRAYLDDSRLEILNHERTTIAPESGG